MDVTFESFLAPKLGILVLKMGGRGYVSFVVGVVVKFYEVGGAPYELSDGVVVLLDNAGVGRL